MADERWRHSAQLEQSQCRVIELTLPALPTEKLTARLGCWYLQQMSSTFAA